MVAHKILVSSPSPLGTDLELGLTGLGPGWVLGTVLTIQSKKDQMKASNVIRNMMKSLGGP